MLLELLPEKIFHRASYRSSSVLILKTKLVATLHQFYKDDMLGALEDGLVMTKEEKTQLCKRRCRDALSRIH